MRSPAIPRPLGVPRTDDECVACGHVNRDPSFLCRCSAAEILDAEIARGLFMAPEPQRATAGR